MLLSSVSGSGPEIRGRGYSSVNGGEPLAIGGGGLGVRSSRNLSLDRWSLARGFSGKEGRQRGSVQKWGVCRRQHRVAVQKGCAERHRGRLQKTPAKNITTEFLLRRVTQKGNTEEQHRRATQKGDTQERHRLRPSQVLVAHLVFASLVAMV